MIPRQLVVFTRQLEILVTTLYLYNDQNKTIIKAYAVYWKFYKGFILIS